jgi:DNA-binding transcriptional ArsR family regulator
MPDAQLTKILKAIADPTRREIFHVLVVASAALSISQISDRFDMTRQGLTKHLKQLESAGLIMVRPEGRERFCEANLYPLKQINEWVQFYDKFWDEKLDNLGRYLDSNE